MGAKAIALVGVFFFAACGKAEQPTAPAQVTLPTPPRLTNAGHALILEFETGGRPGYDVHPEWPGASSGVTIGVGYDLGYYSKAVINSDWTEIQTQPRARLAGVSRFTGSRARQALDSVRDIYVQWEIALGVFDRVDVAREFINARHAMPGFEDIRANAQAALISNGFNRGWSFSGANRTEMRSIRDEGVPKRDYELIALQLRKSERVWKGTSIEKAMIRRREAEAKLVLTP